MRAALLVSTIVLAAMASVAGAAPLPAIDMCAINADTYAGDLNDNGFVAKLPGRLATGTATCDRQITERLGSADGRTYLLSQGWFTYRIENVSDPRQATVAQIAEIEADGRVTVVYRLSQIDSTDAVDARLVSLDGSTLIALTTPTEHLLLRGVDGFAEIQSDLWNVSKEVVDASLPEGYVAEPPEEGTYRVHFDFDALALDLPIAVASEVFPRTIVKPSYDRPLSLRFPLQLQDRELTPGPGEVIVPEASGPAGIGETPASLSVPKTVAACEIYAFIQDSDPAGVSVRATPDAQGQVVATLPGGHHINDGDYSYGAEVDVIGSLNGWFLIENALHPAENGALGYDPESNGQTLGTGSIQVRWSYRGRGWVHGSRLATEIQAGESLSAAADPASKPVFDLKLDGGEEYVDVEGFRSCTGSAVELTVKRHADGIEGSGWIGGGDQARLCSNQDIECV